MNAHKLIKKYFNEIDSENYRKLIINFYYLSTYKGTPNRMYINLPIP